MKIGTQVKWQSQGKGSKTVKVGKIVRIVKSGEIPWKIGLKEFPNHTRMFEGWSLPGGKNTKEAYLIEVIIGQRKPRLYMPFPGKLQKTEEDV